MRKRSPIQFVTVRAAAVLSRSRHRLIRLSPPVEGEVPADARPPAARAETHSTTGAGTGNVPLFYSCEPVSNYAPMFSASTAASRRRMRGLSQLISRPRGHNPRSPGARDRPDRPRDELRTDFARQLGDQGPLCSRCPSCAGADAVPAALLEALEKASHRRARLPVTAFRTATMPRALIGELSSDEASVPRARRSHSSAVLRSAPAASMIPAAAPRDRVGRDERERYRSCSRRRGTSSALAMAEF